MLRNPLNHDILIFRIGTGSGSAAPEGATGACVNTYTRSHGQVTRADSFGSGDCAVSAICGLFCLELF